MNDTTGVAVDGDGLPIWHLQAVALADTALALAEQAAKLAAECATVAASAYQQVENVRLLIRAHQPVPVAAGGSDTTGEPQ